MGRHPPWLRVQIPGGENFASVRRILRSHQLNTVCEDARCPNIAECWGQHRTATFMILGDVCTRACAYCDIEEIISSFRINTPVPATDGAQGHFSTRTRERALHVSWRIPGPEERTTQLSGEVVRAVFPRTGGMPEKLFRISRDSDRPRSPPSKPRLGQIAVARL